MTSRKPWELYYQHTGRDIFYRLAGRYLFARRHVAQKVVLDVACDMGYGTAILADEARMVVGVDSRRHAVAYCMEAHQCPSIRFLQMDETCLGFGDESFDVVVFFESLEYVPDVDLFLKEVRRVLKPGGTLLVSATNGALNSEKRRHAPMRPASLRLDEQGLRQLLSAHFAIDAVWGQWHYSKKDIALVRSDESPGLFAGPDGLLRRTLRVLLRNWIPVSVRSRTMLLAQVWANRYWVGEVSPAHAVYMIAKAVKVSDADGAALVARARSAVGGCNP